MREILKSRIKNLSVKRSRDGVDANECNGKMEHSLTNSDSQFKVENIDKKFNDIITTAHMTPAPNTYERRTNLTIKPLLLGGV